MNFKHEYTGRMRVKFGNRGYGSGGKNAVIITFQSEV
jgi:hypothetical protein